MFNKRGKNVEINTVIPPKENWFEKSGGGGGGGCKNARVNEGR